MDWYRVYHGAPLDAKWVAIAIKAGTVPGVVWSVFSALMDHASQAEPRGSAAGFDVDTVAAFYGWEVETVTAVLNAFRGGTRPIIDAEDMLTAWLRRQPKREDNSADRVRAHRERMKRTVTQGNAPEQSREEQNAAAAAGAGAGEASAGGGEGTTDRHAAVLAIIQAANEAQAANDRVDQTRRKVIPNGHGTSYNAAAEWLADGIPLATILGVVTDRIGNYEPTDASPQVNSLSYLSGAVREAHAAATTPVRRTSGARGRRGRSAPDRRTDYDPSTQVPEFA